jgi:hypothetical protein
MHMAVGNFFSRSSAHFRDGAPKLKGLTRQRVVAV